MENENKHKIHPWDEPPVFVPDKDLRIIEYVLNSWEQVKQVLRKIAEKMKRIEN